MSPKITELRGRATGIARHPRTRKIAIWLVAIFAFVVVVVLVAPPLLKNKIAAELSTKLHRPISIEQIRVNPFTMSLTVRGFLMKERQGAATALSFEEFYANLELRSLFRWAPVLKQIKLVKPYVNLVRNEDRTYNFTDLIEEFTKEPPGLRARQDRRRGLPSIILKSWTGKSTSMIGRNKPNTRLPR